MQNPLWDRNIRIQRSKSTVFDFDCEFYNIEIKRNA